MFKHYNDRFIESDSDSSFETALAFGLLDIETDMLGSLEPTAHRIR